MGAGRGCRRRLGVEMVDTLDLDQIRFPRATIWKL